MPFDRLTQQLCCTPGCLGWEAQQFPCDNQAKGSRLEVHEDAEGLWGGPPRPCDLASPSTWTFFLAGLGPECEVSYRELVVSPNMAEPT